MKKTKKSKGLGASLVNNPVAKFAYQFNRSQVYKDKTKYQRVAKHKGKEPFPMMLSAVLEKVSATWGFVANWLPLNGACLR